MNNSTVKLDGASIGQQHYTPNGSTPEIQTTISPFDGSPVVKRPLMTQSEIESTLARSQAAFESYKLLNLDERIAIADKFLLAFEASEDRLSQELCAQMGRPIAHCAVEVRGTIARGRHMISLARECLADSENKDTDTDDHIRYIKRVPIGPVLAVVPWNYPYFCQCNVVIPALLAGNTVLLKPSPQTPMCGEIFAELYTQAGLPAHVLQVMHINPEQVERVIQDARIQFVMFTGSVAGGHSVTRAASGSFKGVGVELGGKDPAYVRADADLGKVVPALVDGAFFNAGQSCCSVERIYVDEKVYQPFVEQMVEIVKRYKLGEPKDASTTLGPVVSQRSAGVIRKQVADAEAAGAKLLVPSSLFPNAKDGTNLVAPQVLVNVDHSMDIMTAETFGPVVGIMKVTSDEEAIRLMNDSPYGLTASIWTDATSSRREFEAIVEKLQTGTVFLNGCDNLDPALAWSGVKDSGRGVSLSRFGFDAYTRTKSVNIRLL